MEKTDYTYFILLLRLFLATQYVSFHLPLTIAHRQDHGDGVKDSVQSARY